MGTRQGIGRRVVLGSGLALAAPPILHAQGQSAGVALVIGNSKYQWEAPLPNVRRDAPDMAKRFEALGLRTTLIQDAGGQAMRQAIARLRAEAQGARFAAFYFAGHGVAARKDNFIVPLDADLSAAKMDALIPTNMVFGALKSAQNRMAVFDSCRNNPADGALQLETERAASQNVEVSQQRIAENPNTLALYSTSPGHVALDGAAGENSPFAATLMRQLDAPSIDLNALAPRLRRDLLIATQGRQMLWDMNGFTQSFVLKGPANPPPAGRSGGDPSRAMELTKAYAFAQQSGFFVPAGLVAYRATGADARKIGSYKYDVKTPQGPIRPQLFIVLSVADNKALVLQAGINDQVFWSLRLANVSGNKLDLVPRAGAPRFTFDFSDANSGTVNLLPEGMTAGGPPGGGPGGGRPGGGGNPGGGMGSPRGPGPGGGPGPRGYTVQFTRLDG